VSTSIIDLNSQVIQLQAETTKLVDQLSQCEDQAQTERGARHQAEERIRQLENELTSTRTERDNLQQEKTYFFSVNERLMKKMNQRDREVKKVLSALYRMEPDP
jgi:septal ring factor EnvC (AmiA/AmiB activator)